MKKFFVAFAIIFLPISTCHAKIISDVSGRITFETSNNWYPTSVEENEIFSDLHSIALDKDTGVIFLQCKYLSNYKSMMEISETEKSVIRDKMLQYLISTFKNKNYSVRINKTEIFDDMIGIGFSLTRNGLKYKTVCFYFIKDYTIYCLSYLGTDYTISEAAKVTETLKIDGIPFVRWIFQ